MSVYKRPGSEVYSYDFRYRGHRFSGSTETGDKREAKAIEREIRAKAKAATVGQSAVLTVREAFLLYWHEKGQHLANSGDEDRALEWLKNVIGPARRIPDISDRDIAAAVARRRGEGVSNATVNRSVTQPMRAVLRRCARVWKQAVQTIEWKEHFLPESEERVREASATEEAALSSAMRPDYEPAFRFAIMTGCRRAEIVGLEWQHVDFFNEEFTVIGKRGKSRTLPMTKKVRALLWSLKDHHKTAVFTYALTHKRFRNRIGERVPITLNGFKTEWRRTKGRAKVENFRFHDTRHTAATRLVRATGNLKQAQKLLGHTELATTSRYAHVSKEDLRAGMEAASATPLERKTDDGLQKTGE